VLNTPRQLLRDPEVLPLEEVGGKSLNGNGAYWRGKPLGFPQHPGAAKMVVAVDVDEGTVKKHESRSLVSESRYTSFYVRAHISFSVLPCWVYVYIDAAIWVR
jgi:hypothetical protein